MIASICVLVGEDEEVSIKQVADSIVKAIGFAGEYSFDTSRADGQFRKPASNKKLISAMGGFEFTPFEQGTFIDRWKKQDPFLIYDCSIALDETAQWFLQNYEKARIGKVPAWRLR